MKDFSAVAHCLSFIFHCLANLDTSQLLDNECHQVSEANLDEQLYLLSLEITISQHYSDGQLCPSK